MNRFPWPSLQAAGGFIATASTSEPIPVTKGNQQPRYVLLTYIGTAAAAAKIRVHTDAETVDASATGFLLRAQAPLVVNVSGCNRIQTDTGASAVHVAPAEDRMLVHAPEIKADALDTALTASTPTEITLPLTKGGKPPSFVLLTHTGGAADYVQVLPGPVASTDPSKGAPIKRDAPLVLNVSGNTAISVVASAGLTLNVAPLENSGRRNG